MIMEEDKFEHWMDWGLKTLSILLVYMLFYIIHMITHNIMDALNV